MNPRIVLWGTVVVLVVGAAVLPVALGGGDGDDDASAPPRLPLAPAGDGAAAAETGVDAQAIDIAPVAYRAGDDLPALGGTAPAYRVSDVSASEVAALADALGIEGEPTEAGGSWTVTGAGLTLTAYGPSGSWNASTTATGPDTPQSSPAEPAPTGPEEPTSDSGGPPATDATNSTVVCVQAPCDPATTEPAVSDLPADAAGKSTPSLPTAPATVPPCPADPGGTSCAGSSGATSSGVAGSGGATAGGAGSTGTSGTAPACGSDPAVTCIAVEPAVPPTTVDPADLPPQDEAIALAESLSTAAGLSPEGGLAEATIAGDGWLVHVEPTLDGRPAPGLAGQVIVGPGGVTLANGYFAPGDALGDYPLISTREAVERMNRTGDVTIMSTPEEGDMAQAPTSGTAPEPATGPATEPAPRDSAPPAEVVLTEAELAYVTVLSWDNSGSYVVPGYRFRDADGTLVATVPALADEALRSPPSGG